MSQTRFAPVPSNHESFVSLRALTVYYSAGKTYGLLMQKLFVVPLLALLTSAATFAQPGAADSTLVFSHVNVIDMTGAPVQPDMTVIITGQRITEVSKSGGVRVPIQAKVVDAQGKYLIPGLWDMHVHTIFGDWLPRNEKVTLPLFVANG